MSKTILSKVSSVLTPDHFSKAKPIVIHFENNESAVFPTGSPFSEVWMNTIDYQKELNQPVYVAVDDNGVISDVLSTIHSKIRFISDEEDYALLRLETVDTMFYIFHDEPDAENMILIAQEISSRNMMVRVVAKYSRVIELHPYIPYDNEIALEDESTVQYIPIDNNNLTPITTEQAKALFNEMLASGCITGKSYKTACIPFRFPAGGCWVRAHLMCYKMMADKIVPGKVWCFSSGRNMLTAKTDNDWNCSVSWDFHVAPVVMVQQEDGLGSLMVFDPSLATGPITPEQWQGMMDRGGSNLIYSDWKQYERFSGSATHNRANKDMNAFRLLFDKMCAEHGLPPYEKCRLGY